MFIGFVFTKEGTDWVWFPNGNADDTFLLKTHWLLVFDSLQERQQIKRGILDQSSSTAMLWQYCQRRNQATLGGVENSDFNFYASGPRRVPVSEPRTKDSQDI
jgi:hypothetical protein